MTYPQCDRDVMRQFLETLQGKSEAFEIRALHGKKKLSGYFDIEHVNDAIEEAVRLSEAGWQIYVNAQPLKSDASKRVTNEMSPARSGGCTANADIERMRWFIIDLDPYRPTGCATDNEKQAVSLKAEEMKSHFKRLGFSEPMVCDSGNGQYVMYQLDADIDKMLVKRVFMAAKAEHDDIEDIIKRSLEMIREQRTLTAEALDDEKLVQRVSKLAQCDEQLAARALATAFAEYGRPPVIVDTAFSRPMQIIRWLGTVNLKGDNTEDRPHRLSKIVHIPDLNEKLKREDLARLADSYHEVPKTPGLPHYKGKYDAAVEYWSEWLAERNVGFAVSKRYDAETGEEYIALCFDECPLSGERDGGAAILIHPSKGVWGDCYHTKCNGKQLEDILLKIDPSYKDTIDAKVSQVVLGDDSTSDRITNPDRLAAMVQRHFLLQQETANEQQTTQTG